MPDWSVNFVYEQLVRKSKDNGLDFKCFGVASQGMQRAACPNERAECFAKQFRLWSEEIVQTREIDNRPASFVLNFWPLFAEALFANLGHSTLIVCFSENVSFVRTERAKREYVNWVSGQCLRVGQVLRGKVAALRSEMSKKNSQPLLLPRSNFSCAALGGFMDKLVRLNAAEVGGIDPVQTTDSARRLVASTTGANGRRWFSDDNGLQFATPGRDEHGGGSLLKKGGSHKPKCFVAGYYRFGVPINPGFHFDVTGRVDGPVSKVFLDCHGAEMSIRRAKYVNIYPNDFVRVVPKK
ncbi:MAG TPA: hypothetical protein PKD10_15345 [Paracoccaceae bacterium]|nr:hypothetical protein [Paracoccaceae bacterium]HMO70492.1 hypothetical protein [Paracoccaceae bacterium]